MLTAMHCLKRPLILNNVLWILMASYLTCSPPCPDNIFLWSGGGINIDPPDLWKRRSNWSDLKYIFRGTTAWQEYERVLFTIILWPKKEDRLKINQELLFCLPGVCLICESVDSAVCEDEQQAASYPQESLHSLTPSGMPPHKFNL